MRITVTMRLSEENIVKLDDLAKRRGVTRANLVTWALAEFLEKY